jgi:hypothetical protein
MVAIGVVDEIGDGGACVIKVMPVVGSAGSVAAAETCCVIESVGEKGGAVEVGWEV